MFNQLSEICKDFYAKPANKAALFCDNGIFSVTFNVLKSPVYYTYEVKEYNPQLRRFEFVHCYGSPYSSDVVFNFEDYYKL